MSKQATRNKHRRHRQNERAKKYSATAPMDKAQRKAHIADVQAKGRAKALALTSCAPIDSGIMKALAKLRSFRGKPINSEMW